MSSTTIPTLSIRLSAMCPIYKVSSSLTTDLFATPKQERDVEPDRSLPNSAYSGRITRHPSKADLGRVPGGVPLYESLTTGPEPGPLWLVAQGQRSPQYDLVLRAVLDGNHSVLESHVFDLAEIGWRTGVEHQKAAVDRRLRRQPAEGGRAEHSVL